jgi:uncharacterized protein with GYD domain
MATFVVLAGFTDQGIRNVKETVGRAETFKEMARKSGVTVKDLYWTLGQHDVVAVCEAADDEGRDRTLFECFLARQCPLPNAARLLVRGNEGDP